MIYLYFALLIINLVSALEIHGKDCPYCDEHALRCAAGHVVQSACVRCVCAPNGTYLCTATPCSDEQKENVILGKPMHATCESRMMYMMDDVTCLCGSDGTWPHDKCEVLFGSLHSKSTFEDRPQPTPKRKAQRCIPDSYFIDDCNVCKCSPEGEVARARCTRNNCSNRSRRTYEQVGSSCLTGNWYSLAPCQFCYCHKPSKLVCSANIQDNKYIQVETFNITNCGNDLMYSIVDVIPTEMLEEVMDGIGRNTAATKTKARPSTLPDKNKHDLTSLRLGQNTNVDGDRRGSGNYDDSDGDGDNVTALKDVQNKMTVQPFSDSSEEKEQDLEENAEENNVNAEKSEIDEQISKPAVPKKKKAKTTPNPESLVEETPEPDNVSKVQLSLPSVLHSILNFALRKSMVTVSQNNCVPGTTTKDGCNSCFCLANGNMICSNRGCEQNQ